MRNPRKIMGQVLWTLCYEVGYMLTYGAFGTDPPTPFGVGGLNSQNGAKYDPAHRWRVKREKIPPAQGLVKRTEVTPTARGGGYIKGWKDDCPPYYRF